MAVCNRHPPTALLNDLRIAASIFDPNLARIVLVSQRSALKQFRQKCRYADKKIGANDPIATVKVGFGRFEPLARGRGQSMSSTVREWLHRVESGSLVIGHINDAARRWCPTSLLRSVGSRYSEEPWVEIL